MRSLSKAEAGTRLIDLIDQVQHEPVFVTDENGRGVVLLSMEDYQAKQRAAGERFIENWKRLGEEIRERARREGLSPEDLMRMLDRKAE